VADGGWSGVDLFFVLSGFLITDILLDAKGKPHYFRNFYVRRVLRIFPVYYAALFLYFVIFPILPHLGFAAYVEGSRGDQVWFWTYLTNFRLSWLGHWYPNVVPNVYWSLSVEEHFYLLWPAVVWLTDRRRLVWVCVALLAGALGLRILLYATGAGPIPNYVLTPCRLDSIAAGGLIAVLVRERGIDPLLPWARAGLVAGLALVAGIAVREGAFRESTPLMSTVGYSVLWTLFGSLLVLSLASAPGRPLHRIFTARPMAAFGKYSYAIYLLHAPIGSFLTDVLRPKDVPHVLKSQLPGMLYYGVATTLAAFLAAWLSWHLLEKHFLRLKRFFEGGR
jgi:peptidoglycan/LPS O-acetylase OafA/YrhL